MTSDDYIEWAEEYRQEAVAVEHLIEKKKKLYRSKIGNIERMELERALSDLYEQRIQCIGIAKELEERAQAIREKKGR